ncbi:MAG: hypothetical protein GY822_11835 [Deltaproteobacteria bacterium]|nr:hypothetical protein [Deltaproteobacteria bacterium]
MFNDVNVGNTAQQSSILKNIGATPISVTLLRVGQQLPVEYLVSTAQTLPYTLLPNAEMTVYVDFSPQVDSPSTNTVHAVNDQPSGLAPVLNLQGAGYIPPGGPNLEVVMGPETILDAQCICQSAVGIPAANVDLTYRSISTNQICGKPADPSCGIDGACPCAAMSSYGEVDWSSARTEIVDGQQWIIDEQIAHGAAGGLDGTLAIRTELQDDCIAFLGVGPVNSVWACIQLDCNYAWNPGAPQACFDYGITPVCTVEANTYADGNYGCLARGPVAIKTKVCIFGGEAPAQTREFCTTLGSSGQGRDVVQVVRSAGYFTFGTVQPDVVEVTPGTPCE